MKLYDIEDFSEWLKKHYAKKTVERYLQPFKVADTKGISWYRLQELTPAEIYTMVTGKSEGITRSAKYTYSCGISSYRQYLEWKEREA